MITDLQASALASLSALIAFLVTRGVGIGAGTGLRIRSGQFLRYVSPLGPTPCRAGPRSQRVGSAMVAAVPVERRWHLVMAEDGSGIAWPISTLTRMKKHRANERLCFAYLCRLEYGLS